MSHTATIDTKFFDEAACVAAAEEMKAEIVRGKLQLFDGVKVENGFGVKLEGWNYPVIIDTKTGEAKYDNFNGRWGDVSHLNKFKQLYAAHKTVMECKKKGWLATRTVKADGTIKLQITNCQ
ncbi:MAG: DUF1257 domain-containing protein [Verrucomicrobiota bacterium]